MNTPCLVRHVAQQTIRTFAIAVASCLAINPATARGQTFTGVGLLPGGTHTYVGNLSSDGSVVVGTGNTPGGDRVFRWTLGGGAVSLGTLPGGIYTNGGVVSHDGSVVVGTNGPSTHAFRWTAGPGGGTMQDLGTLPPLEGGIMSFGYGVSGDGAVVAGMGDDNDSPQLAVRWTSATGMVRLGTPSGTYSIAAAANLDGSVIVGNSTASGDPHAFRWTATGIVDIGTLPGGRNSGASSVSDDGAVAAGTSQILDGIFTRVRATRWITDGGGNTTLLNLGTLPNKAYSRGYAVSNNGAVVVGLSGNDVEHERATLWNASTGLVDLNTYLPTIGINLTGWTLTNASGVTGDGRTIAGNGTHNGVSEGWVATIPPPPSCFTLSTVQNASACSGGSATFSLTASGTGPFTYRWRRNGTSINTIVNSSAATATLVLSGLSAPDAGTFDCVAYNTCTTLTSNAATLNVFASGSGDGNGNGVTDGDDISGFVSAVLQNVAPTAAYCAYDMNSDGQVNSTDVDSFVGQLIAN